MSIVLFAILGATVNAGAAYWTCFGVYSVLRAAKAIIKIFNAVTED